MTYDFLKDFHRRTEIVAIVDFITTRVSRKIKFREYEFDGSEAINLAMLVLCFIMEKSLVEEICTKNDIAGFIRRLDVDYLKKNIPDEEYLSIADYLIKDCLQNSGIPHYFSTYNFETGKEEKINIKLIDDKRVSMGNDTVYSYYMTPQGYKFMFNTLEIEDAMKVSIEQFKLSLSIKKRNFNAARNNADGLFNISRTQIQRINYFIKRVKEDIGSTGIEEYEKIYNSTFSSIDEQKRGYDDLYELIGKVEDSIVDSHQAGIDREALNKEIENISYIKNRLKLIITEQSNLLLKQQELQRIYDEAVDNILYIGFENRLNFEETVIKKMEENPDLAYPLIKILRPLFKPELDKIFNIKKALKEQRIAATETFNEGSGILMSERYFNKLESENDIKIRNTNERYLDLFEIICKNALAAPDKQILLSKLVEVSKAEYHRIVPDLKLLTNVLLQLSSIKDVDFTTIKNQKSKTVFNPSAAFDIKYCVLELLNRDRRYHEISSLKILLSRNETVFIPEKLPAGAAWGHSSDPKEIPPAEGCPFTFDRVSGLNCPDILFKAEVNKI
ncbi:MAG: hypothetical protein RO469_03500 [Thermincola sp.]|nr:hypothetical protein [Thermincola sp.]MDT3704358.1 hypothetical protein [Thermincola sp.]